jgi:hypothetical protein
MDPSTTATVFYAALALFGGIWLAGTAFAFSRLRAPAGGNELMAPDGPDADEITGTLTVRGGASSIEAKLAERLAAPVRPGMPPLVRVTRRSDGHIVFERTPGMGSGFDGGRIELTPDGDRVQVKYAIAFGRFNRLMRLIVNLVCFAYGGLFVVGTPILIWIVVVNSPQPETRWQVIQMLQMVHGVWPPFLIGFLVRRIRTASAGQIEALIADAEHAT